jgi:enoyl-CoA hydratase
MVLTGRAVSALEGMEWGLVNRITDPGRALDGALELAALVASHPQPTLRVDRRSTRLAPASLHTALSQEFEAGLNVMQDARQGAARFVEQKSKL